MICHIFFRHQEKFDEGKLFENDNSFHRLHVYEIMVSAMLEWPNLGSLVLNHREQVHVKTSIWFSDI